MKHALRHKKLKKKNYFNRCDMPTPFDVKLAIEQALVDVREDSSHTLSPMQRNRLYETFGPSYLPDTQIKLEETIESGIFLMSCSDKAYGWLSVLTAKHVLPIWERSIIPSGVEDQPSRIIETTEKTLKEEIDAENAYNLLFDKFYHELGWVSSHVTFEAACVVTSAYKALETIFYRPKILQNSIDVSPTLTGDTTSLAVKAYTTVDRSRPGYWLQQNKDFVLHFDVKNRLEFWEWWLTEAIPQAWAMVE